MSGTDELKNMLLTFRVSELQMLLGFAGQNKTGRKNELQARALELLSKSTTTHARQVHTKIRELYKSIQQGGSVMQGGATPGVTPTSLEMTLESRGGVLTPTMAPTMARNINTTPPPPPAASQMSFLPMSSRQNLYGSLYSYPPKLPQVQPPPPIYPIQPDVRLKRLPFYEVLSELLKPSSLVPASTQREQSSMFVFYLTPAQATEIAINREVGATTKNEYHVQVQMRFCLLETSCEQEDIFPPGIVVKVNGKLCPLPNPIPINRPNVEPKRPPRPVNISNWCKLCPSISNLVAVSWTPEYGRGYVISINLVRKLTSNDLLQKMKAKGIRHSDFTTGLIKEKLCEDADSEIATTSLRVSLLCPLGKMRMATPCRPSTCTHLQCFDASLFLQMNEKKPTWVCPVCDKPAVFDNLVIDGYFQQVLASPLLAPDCQEIQLHKDGSWTAQASKKESAGHSSLTRQEEDLAVEEIIDDLDEISESETKTEVRTEPNTTKEDPASTAADAPKNAAACKVAGKILCTVDLTFSDSSDDEVAETPAKTDAGKKTSSNSNGGVASASSNAGGESRPEVVNGQTPHYPLLALWTKYATLATSHSSCSNSGGRNSSSPSIITLDSPSPPPLTPPPTRIATPPTFDQAFMDLTHPSPTADSASTASASTNSAAVTSNKDNAATTASPSHQIPTAPVLLQQQQHASNPSTPSPSTPPALPLAATSTRSSSSATLPPLSPSTGSAGSGTSSPQLYPPQSHTPTSPHPTYNYVRIPHGGSRYHPY